MNIGITVGERIMIARERRGVAIGELGKIVYSKLKKEMKAPGGRIRKIEHSELKNEVGE